MLIETIVIVILTLLAERVVNVPREIRRNDRRIGRRDEDLHTWIEHRDKRLRRQLIGTIRPRSNRLPPKLVPVKRSMLRAEVRDRYRDQLRDAERVAEDVRDSEQLPHRIARWLLHRPIPTLTAPGDQAEVIARWDQAFKNDPEFVSGIKKMVAEVQRKGTSSRAASSPRSTSTLR